MDIQQLIQKKSLLIAQKTASIKYADHCTGVLKIYDKQDAEKAIGQIDSDVDKIRVKAVMNTTNVIDSHMDLHVKGIWNKTIKENKMLYHLEGHKMDFDHVITDNVKASVETVSFKELGYDLEGETQALVFMSEIDKSNNAKMFDRYAKGQVKNHSVGMRYVKIALAVEDKRYKEEREVWEKYYDQIANKSVADENGYFWAVTEAKLIEGSAVLLGSNYITPTQSVEAVKNTFTEPTIVTQIDPIKYLTENFNKK